MGWISPHTCLNRKSKGQPGLEINFSFIISVIMLPVAYFAYWMEHSIVGFLSYFGIFVFIFAFIWIVQFAIGKHNVKRLNENLHHGEFHEDM